MYICFDFKCTFILTSNVHSFWLWMYIYFDCIGRMYICFDFKCTFVLTALGKCTFVLTALGKCTFVLTALGECIFVLNVHLAQCTSFESIEFFNTPEPERPWKTDVEKGFVWTNVGHESVDPKASGKHYKIVWCFLMTRPQHQPKGNEVLFPQLDSGTDWPSYWHGNVKWAWDFHPSSGKSCLFCISRRGPGIPSRREWVLV